jgi:hypothetical protein
LKEPQPDNPNHSTEHIPELHDSTEEPEPRRGTRTRQPARFFDDVYTADITVRVPEFEQSRKKELNGLCDAVFLRLLIQQISYKAVKYLRPDSS